MWHWPVSFSAPLAYPRIYCNPYASGKLLIGGWVARMVSHAEDKLSSGMVLA